MDDLLWTTIAYEAKRMCPNKEGVYIIHTIKEDGIDILYIGRSKKLANRLLGHTAFVKMIEKGLPENDVVFVKYVLTEDSVRIESELINKHLPKHNGSFRSKNISPIVNQIKEAMDGRKVKWLCGHIGVTQHYISKKLTGKMPFNEDELKKIEQKLEFKIQR